MPRTVRLGRILWILAGVFGITPASALAADDLAVERLATCQDSWLDWQKNAPEQLASFGDHFRSAFRRSGNDPYFVPKTQSAIAGFRVLRAMPDSVGMGVGFSVVVAASFDDAKQTLEHKLRRTLGKCESGDGMRACELEIGEMRTLMVMAEDSSKSAETLIGCYYLYEK